MQKPLVDTGTIETAPLGATGLREAQRSRATPVTNWVSPSNMTPRSAADVTFTEKGAVKLATQASGSEISTHHVGLGLSMMLPRELSAGIVVLEGRGFQMRRERALQRGGHLLSYVGRGVDVKTRGCVGELMRDGGSSLVWGREGRAGN
jgi:hypothetical protein